MEIDASILDVSTELISETPIKRNQHHYPQSTSQDVMKCLGIVAEKEGRVDAATSNT